MNLDMNLWGFLEALIFCNVGNITIPEGTDEESSTSVITGPEKSDLPLILPSTVT